MLNTEVTQKIQHIALCMQNNESLHYEDSPERHIWHKSHGVNSGNDEILCELPLRQKADGVKWYVYAGPHHDKPQKFASGLVMLLKRAEGNSIESLFNHFYQCATESCMPTTYHRNSSEVYRESCTFLSALDGMSSIISIFNGCVSSDEDACYGRFDIQIYIPILSNTSKIDIISG